MLCIVVMGNQNHSSPTDESSIKYKQFDLNSMHYSKSYRIVYNDVFDEKGRMYDDIENNFLKDNQEPIMESFQYADSVKKKQLLDHANDDAMNKQSIQQIHILNYNILILHRENNKVWRNQQKRDNTYSSLSI